MYRLDNRFWIIVGSLLLITGLHYGTQMGQLAFHIVYRGLYYIPIILAAFWYDRWGGMVCALAVTCLYIPHVVLQWGGTLAVYLDQALEILLYNVVGNGTGIVIARERAERQRYQQAVQALERSYQLLEKQTERIAEIENQLRQADRFATLGELAADMAHEVKNPLGSIKGTAEILAGDCSPDDPKFEFVQILFKEVDRLNRVINDFLNFARPAPMRLDYCLIQEVLESVLNLVSYQIRKQKVVLETRWDESIPPLLVDPNQLRQAFLNLILNALAAMPEGGKLWVQTAWHNGTKSGGENERLVEIRICDSGQGIPPEHLKRLWKPFFTTKPNGSGLGLAITRRIVAGHKGHIAIESEVGRGTLVRTLLPVRKEAEVI